MFGRLVRKMPRPNGSSTIPNTKELELEESRKGPGKSPKEKRVRPGGPTK